MHDHGHHPEPPRPLTRRHVVAIGTGAMFSSGFFLLPGLAHAETGPAMPLAYLLGGLLALPTMLAVAELSTAMPRAGGPYHFFSRAMGPRAALVGGLGLWVALVGKASFALVGIEAYLGLLVDVPAAVPAVALAAVFTVANLAGARESARVQLWLVGLLLGVLVLVSATGLVELAGGEFDGVGELEPLLPSGVLGLFAAVGLVFVSFAGVPQIASIAGEVRDPARDIPSGVLISLAVGTGAYVVGTTLMVLTLPGPELSDDLTPVASMAREYALPAGEVLVVAAALAAFASTANAGIMSASRYPLAAARDRVLWAPFARVSRSGVPRWGVVATGAAVTATVLAFDTDTIARAASAIVLLSFAVFNLAVLVLRRARAIGYRPTFRVPGAPWTPTVGAAVTVPLIADLGLQPALLVLGVVVVGAVWATAAGRRDDHVERDRQVGALSDLVARRRVGGPHLSTSVDRLQETGPLPGDEAPELLASMGIETADGAADPATLRAAAVGRLTDELGASAVEVERWMRGAYVHVVPRDEPVEVFGLLHDGTATTAALAVDGRIESEGRAVALIAMPHRDHARLRRICALLGAQLIAWHHETIDAPPGSLADALARDAAQRGGADPPRP